MDKIDRQRRLPLPLLLFVSLVMLVAGMAGCRTGEVIGPLSVSVEEFTDVAAEGDTLKVIVTSARDFVPTADVSWLTTNLPLGSSRNKVTITVAPNLTDQVRQGTVTFATPDGEEGERESVAVKVSQLARGDGFVIDSVLYELPVIFHVLTNPEDIAKKDAQNNDDDPYNDYTKVTASSLQKLLDQVNQLYAGNPPYPLETMRAERYHRNDLVNARIRFVLATTDPEGKQLSPAGVDAHDIEERSLDPALVMGDEKGGKYHEMSYPIDRYINVYIFPYSSGEDPQSVTLGVSHLPHLHPDHALEGLGELDHPVSAFDNYNHCVTINYAQFEDRLIRTQSNYLIHNQLTLAAETLAHELGHYLGLHHVFAEKLSEDGGSLVMTEECLDSDHVEDTPSYNRISYSAVMRDQTAAIESSQGATQSSVLASLLGRDLCNGRFNQTSFNLMDYEISYSDRFTRGQIERMRHVLYYSFSVPGDKMAAPRSGTLRSSGTTIKPMAVSCSTTLHTTPLR